MARAVNVLKTAREDCAGHYRIDWIELSFNAMSPYALVHGKGRTDILEQYADEVRQQQIDQYCYFLMTWCHGNSQQQNDHL